MYPIMTKPSRERLRRMPRRSLLQASALARCLVVGALCALLWLAVAWAMEGA